MELFTLHDPVGEPVPIIAHLPHSGVFVPDSVAAQFTTEHLAALPNTDWHLDKLYNFLPELGVTVMQATHSRYVVDLNRELSEPLFGPFWSSAIAERTALDKQIYRTQPKHDEILARVEQFYKPYHKRLKKLVEDTVAQFGRAYLLHLHSFFWPPQNEVDLGDVNGQSCSEFLIASVERHFQAQGYKVARNSPYAGGPIVKCYGAMPDAESLQIEVRYHLYLRASELDKTMPPKSEILKMEMAQASFREVFSSVVQDIQ